MSHSKTRGAVFAGRDGADSPFLCMGSREHQGGDGNFCSVEAKGRSKKQLLGEGKLWESTARGLFPTCCWFSPWTSLHTPSVQTPRRSSPRRAAHANCRPLRAETRVCYFSAHKGPLFQPGPLGAAVMLIMLIFIILLVANLAQHLKLK